MDVSQKRKKTLGFQTKTDRPGQGLAIIANPFDHPTQFCAHKCALA